MNRTKRTLGMALLIWMVGCKPNEDVSRTTEPRVDYGKTEPLKNDQAKSEKIPTRILGGIADEGKGQSWFFKIMGPAEAVAKQEAAFDSFLASVHFADQTEKPVTWTLPEGWREGPAKGRYATLITGPQDDSLELSVMPAGGNLLENINRWRGQVGLTPVRQDTLDRDCREVTTKQGKKITRVDLTGMAGKGPVMPPFMKGR